MFWEIHNNKGLPKKPHCYLIEKIVPYKLLKKIVTVELTDAAASVIVIGDIGRILRENVADNLVNGVVALLSEGLVDLHEDFLHFLVAVVYGGEFNGIAFHTLASLFPFPLSYTKTAIK
jgi:hypothetical protein